MVDVDSPHISSVKSDYQDQEIKTETQAIREEHEAEDKAREEAKEAAERAEQKAQELGEKAKKEGRKAKAIAKKDAQKVSENRDNPVVIGNALIWGIGSIALASAAYQKHKEGRLDWQLVGSAAAVVAAFGVADYAASKYVTLVLSVMIVANHPTDGFSRTSSHPNRGCGTRATTPRI